MKISGIFCLILLFLVPTSVFTQDLAVNPEDLRFEQSVEGGYYLYIRKKPGIQSVLLTESTADPEKKLASYALRGLEYHPENGEEPHILNGEFLPKERIFSLIDSSAVEDDQLGEAFRIFIPYVVQFGYSYTERSGQFQVLDGTWLNIRTFPLPYADYSGGFQDNPFILRVSQMPLDGPPDGNFMEETVESFSRLSEATDGRLRYSTGEEDLIDTIGEILDSIPDGTLDLVLSLDATESMQNDLPFLKSSLVPLLEEKTARFDAVRVGFVYYRDYLEEFLFKTNDFSDDFSVVQTAVNGIRVAGGRDIPEAVNEALFAGITEFIWQADNRLIILVGDAPPHPLPRGSITEQMVLDSAIEENVDIHAIILPQ
jgi:hypothetical protein